jgi:hypothetical protein
MRWRPLVEWVRPRMIGLLVLVAYILIYLLSFTRGTLGV